MPVANNISSRASLRKAEKWEYDVPGDSVWFRAINSIARIVVIGITRGNDSPLGRQILMS